MNENYEALIKKKYSFLLVCSSWSSPSFPPYFVLWLVFFSSSFSLPPSLPPPQPSLPLQSFLCKFLDRLTSSSTSLPEFNVGNSQSQVQSPLARRERQGLCGRAESLRLSPDPHVYLPTPHIINKM